MITVENHIGSITVSEKYLASLVKHTVSDCFGVVGVCCANPFHSIVSAVTFGKAFKKFRGISIHADKNGSLVIDLHIKVTYGTNITAAVESIVHKVCFNVEEASGADVSAVNVFVDELCS